MTCLSLSSPSYKSMIFCVDDYQDLGMVISIFCSFSLPLGSGGGSDLGVIIISIAPTLPYNYSQYQRILHIVKELGRSATPLLPSQH